MKKTMVLLCALLLAGCTKEYKKSDIEEYVRKNLGLSGFRVSSSYETLEDEEGYKDRLWTVTEQDGTVFGVLDDYGWGMESVSNWLHDDRNAVRLIQLYEQTDHDRIELEAGRAELHYAQLTGTFRSRSELRALFEELQALDAHNTAGARLLYEFRFDHPYRCIGDYELDDGDARGALEPGETEDPGAAEMKLLHQCIDMRYEEQLKEFSEEEIRRCVQYSDHRLGIVQEDGTIVYYDDLLANEYHYGVSFSTIYELLVRNGYPVEGTKDDFVFTALDGSVYEYANGFRENEWYYFIKDGEHVPMEAYFYNHLRVKEVEELTGIPVIEYWMAQKVE